MAPLASEPWPPLRPPEGARVRHWWLPGPPKWDQLGNPGLTTPPETTGSVEYLKYSKFFSTVSTGSTVSSVSTVSTVRGRRL